MRRQIASAAIALSLLWALLAFIVPVAATGDPLSARPGRFQAGDGAAANLSDARISRTAGHESTGSLVQLVPRAYLPLVARWYDGPAPTATPSPTAPPTTSPTPTPTAGVAFTILHTNDLHGYLQPYPGDGLGGFDRIAGGVNAIRAEVGEESVLLMDGGDIMLRGSPLSDLVQGESTIDIYNRTGYDVVTIGNHDFDFGIDVVMSRVSQSEFPWLGANVVMEGTEWDHPAWLKPYVLLPVGAPGNQVTLGVIGVTTDQRPTALLMARAERVDIRHPAEAVLRYRDEVRERSDAMIVLAHMGTSDDDPYIGLVTLAQELIDAGKPIDLMIGAHQHQALYEPVVVGTTKIIEAGSYGRWLGRADVSVDPQTKTLTLERYNLMVIDSDVPVDPEIADRIAYWVEMLQPTLNTPVGTTVVDLVRHEYAESNLGNLVADAILWQADVHDDGELNRSVQVGLVNYSRLKADILIPAGAPIPHTVIWEDTYDVLPQGNTQYLMDLTGAQLQAILDQAASLYRGILHTSGATWRWHNDCRCSNPTSWGATDIEIGAEPLDLQETYRVVVNNYLAGGEEGWTTFAQGTNRVNTQYDQRDALNDYIAYYNGMVGPIDYVVEGRIEYYVP